MSTSQPIPIPRKKLMQLRFKDKVAGKYALKTQNLNNNLDNDYELSEYDSDQEFWPPVERQDESN